MSMASFSNQDLDRIAWAAIALDESAEKIEPGSVPAETVKQISDGDEDIPAIIANLALMRRTYWNTFEQALAFLRIERELDQEDEEETGGDSWED